MNDSVTVFKALGDGTRTKILKMLKEKECYVEMLSERLGLTPATVSFHIKKLMLAGVIKARREQYYTMYSLDENALNVNISTMLFGDKPCETEVKSAETAFRDKVIKAFMPCGYCEMLPSHSKKRRVIFEEIIKRFEPGKTYPESEVNEIISDVHGDYCMIRRSFIELGWMTRERNVYTVTYSPENAAAGERHDI